jgi:hypothetical protein
MEREIGEEDFPPYFISPVVRIGDGTPTFHHVR